MQQRGGERTAVAITVLSRIAHSNLLSTWPLTCQTATWLACPILAMSASRRAFSIGPELVLCTSLRRLMRSSKETYLWRQAAAESSDGSRGNNNDNNAYYSRKIKRTTPLGLQTIAWNVSEVGGEAAETANPREEAGRFSSTTYLNVGPTAERRHVVSRARRSALSLLTLSPDRTPYRRI